MCTYPLFTPTSRLPSDGNASGKKNPASLKNPMRKCKSVGNVFFRFFLHWFREACNALCGDGDERGSLLPTGSTSGARRAKLRNRWKGFWGFYSSVKSELSVVKKLDYLITWLLDYLIISKSTLLWQDKPRVVASTATFSGCCPLTSRYAQGKKIYLFSKKLFPQSKNPFR